MAKKKPVKNPKVPRPRAAGTMTEAQYWGKVRSALRKAFASWRPAELAFRKAECGTRTNPKTGREKKIYLCAICRVADYREEMQADHIEPCGSLRSLDDLAPFLDRLTCEDSAMFQAVHKRCHQEKTNEDRRKKIGKPGQYEQVVSGTSMSMPNNGFVPPGEPLLDKKAT